MDQKITNLLEEYNKLENKYPNIIRINRKILEFHINKMKESIQKCEEALEAIKTNNRDLTQEQILSLYLTLPFIIPQH
tara:strand:- start:5460 stop:5693 length:234 start_codon:yes stop_codon:yes gene_type:complete